jgi:small-conductance mechanosensitive channel
MAESFFDIDKLHPLFVALRMVFLLLATLTATSLFKRYAKRRMDASINLKFLYSIISAALYFLGFVATLRQLPSFEKGFDTIVAGSGIFALVFGLAAQESLSNIVNGVFISIFKPFEVNNRIHLNNAGITGIVEDITLRHTVVRTFQNSRLIITNTAVNKDIIENSHFTDSKSAGYVDVTLSYDADLDRACAIMSEAVKNHPRAVSNSNPSVNLRSFGIYGIELRVTVWTADINANYDVTSDVRKAIKRTFDEEGIAFGHYPDPSS